MRRPLFEQFFLPAKINTGVSVLGITLRPFPRGIFIKFSLFLLLCSLCAFHKVSLVLPSLYKCIYPQYIEKETHAPSPNRPQSYFEQQKSSTKNNLSCQTVAFKGWTMFVFYLTRCDFLMRSQKWEFQTKGSPPYPHSFTFEHH